MASADNITVPTGADLVLFDVADGRKAAAVKLQVTLNGPIDIRCEPLHREGDWFRLSDTMPPVEIRAIGGIKRVLARTAVANSQISYLISDDHINDPVMQEYI